MSFPVFFFGGKNLELANVQLLKFVPPRWWLPHPFIIFRPSGKFHCFGGLGATAWGPGHADPHVAAKVAANHSTTSFSPESLCQLIELNQLKNSYRQKIDREIPSERQRGSQVGKQAERCFGNVKPVYRRRRLQLNHFHSLLASLHLCCLRS